MPSPSHRTPNDLVVVGRLGAPFGVRGEVKCRPGSFGAEAFAQGRTYRLGLEPEARVLECTGVRPHQESLLLGFAGIDSPEAARLLTNRNVYASAHSVPLAEGEYLDADLIDCELVDPVGRPLGRVFDVQHFPAQDCLVVGPARLFVPLVRAFVRRIDIARKTIEVELPDGMLEP